MYKLEKKNTSSLCIFCMLVPLTLTLVWTSYEESTPPPKVKRAPKTTTPTPIVGQTRINEHMRNFDLEVQVRVKKELRPIIVFDLLCNVGKT